MIQSSSGVSMAQFTQQPTRPLTEEQGTKLTEILSKYDATNVTSGEAQKIVTEIKEAGITPGKGLTEAMSAEGFDAKQIGDAGKPEGDRPPPPPPPSGEAGQKGTVDSAAISMLSDIIDSFGDEEMTTENWASVLAQLEENGVSLSDPMVDIRV